LDIQGRSAWSMASRISAATRGMWIFAPEVQVAALGARLTPGSRPRGPVNRQSKAFIAAARELGCDGSSEESRRELLDILNSRRRNKRTVKQSLLDLIQQ
jgi:hypothetical protein